MKKHLGLVELYIKHKGDLSKVLLKTEMPYNSLVKYFDGYGLKVRDKYRPRRFSGKQEFPEGFAVLPESIRERHFSSRKGPSD